MGVFRKLADLKQDPKNARAHNPRNIGMISEALQEIGAARSGVIDEDGNILAGNGTFEALSQVGIEKIKVVVAKGDEWVVVQRKGLTPEEKVKLALYDNRAAELAEWNPDALGLLADDHPGILDDLFSNDELESIFGDSGAVGELEGEDNAPEVPEEPITQMGDMYQLGDHFLLCGDSTVSSDVETLMQGQKADMVFTDPPYNIDYGNNKSSKHKIRPIENDNMTRHDFLIFCRAFIQRIKESCQGCVYVFGPPGPDGRITFTSLDSELHCSTTIIWNKDQFTLGRGKYQNKYEPCWFGWNLDGVRFTSDRKLTNVWDHPRPKSSELHPTMKPVGLIEMAVAHASRNGDSVLDLFGGSGSTMIACEKLKRKCYMMELDPGYCDVIIERYKTLFPEKETCRLSGEIKNAIGDGSTTGPNGSLKG